MNIEASRLTTESPAPRARWRASLRFAFALDWVHPRRHSMNAPIRVAVTGAAGQIGYSLLFRIASGAMFGPTQPVILHLIEIEPALKALSGVVMELDDCAFPLLQGVVPTASLDEGFRMCQMGFNPAVPHARSRHDQHPSP